MVSLPVFQAAKKAGRSSRPRKSLSPRPNGRSADFIMASFATGCQLACAYCYVARHRPFGNPVETYTNLDAILDHTHRHWQSLLPKSPNQCDPVRWTYDIGESTDCLTPAVLPLTRRTIDFFIGETDAKPTFATKVAGGLLLPELTGPDRGRVRVRASLMPDHIARVVEACTSPVPRRIEAVNAWVERGYEVHLNFSPVIAYTGWVADYEALFDTLGRELSDAAKAQLKAEVIFLTHHPRLHELNLQWNPEAEALLWTPKWQETKTTGRGDADVVRYRALRVKSAFVSKFREVAAARLPYCGLRYIF